MKNKFANWYSDQVRNELDKGTPIEDIDVKFPLSKMKPLHGGWLIDLFNALTTGNGKTVIKSGWERSGILDAIILGSKNLPSLDPFAEIDPVETDGIPEFPQPRETNTEYEDETELCADKTDDESDWELEEEQADGNAFDMFDV